MKKIPDFTSPVFKKSSDLSVRISQIPAMDVAFQTMALSEYELLVATIHKLNELITMTNSYSELIDEILKWVVGDGLDASVKDMLTVWLNDGTLETLINDTLFKTKLDKEVFNSFVSDIYNIFKQETQENLDIINSNILNFKQETQESLDIINSRIVHIKDLGFDSVINTSELNPMIKNFESGTTLQFEGKEYIVNGDLIIDTRVTFNGAHKQATILKFNDGGISTGVGVKNYFEIKNMTIENINDVNENNGITLNDYSGFFNIENITIKNFGKWGIHQKGGIDFFVTNVDFFRNGSLSTESGSYKIENNGLSPTTTGVLTKLYARSGGKYAFHFTGLGSFSANTLIAEYHGYAFYGSSIIDGTFIEVYDEANTQAKSITLRNSQGAIFIGGRHPNGVYEEWDSDIVNFGDWYRTNIDKNGIRTKTLSTSSINMQDYRGFTEEKANLRYETSSKKMKVKIGENDKTLAFTEDITNALTQEPLALYRVYQGSEAPEGTQYYAMLKFGGAEIAVATTGADAGHLWSKVIGGTWKKAGV